MGITFIQCGGTIDKDYPKNIRGWNFEIGDPAYFRILEKIPQFQSFNSIALLQKDSLELTDQDREMIAETCTNCADSKIIITHGTDTLLQTAQSLATIPNKTIVITGAMRPERFSNSDADIQLGMALAAVQTLNFGVYIAIQGLIASYDQFDRDLQTGQYFLK